MVIAGGMRSGGGMRPRVGYANVASTLALVVALGGTGAYAASLAKDSVTSKQIKDGAVKSVDLGAASVTGAKVKDGSLTGGDVDESTLGKVPAASRVDTVVPLTMSATLGDPAKPVLTRGAVTLLFDCVYIGDLGTYGRITADSSTNGTRLLRTGFSDEQTIVNAADPPKQVAIGGLVGNRFDASLIPLAGPAVNLSGALWSFSGSTCGGQVAVVG
jgi:hypothetical protein